MILFAEYELNQGLQANLLLLVITIFLAIQFFNSPYYTSALNRLNEHTWFLIVLYIFQQVLIRSAISDGRQEGTQDSLLGSLTGRELPDEYREITRSNAFSSDEELMEVIVVVPLVILFIISDLYFLWHLWIQFLAYLLESNKNSKLFNFFSCNCISQARFRKKYMIDYEGKDDENDQI